MTKKIESHRDLIVWQKAMDLVVMIYALTKTLPLDERFRMVNQMTRSAASIPANIAEGHARGTARDFAQFLSIAKGSLMETQTFVELTVRLNYLTSEETAPVLNQITEISKMLTTLRTRILSSVHPKASLQNQ
ncbi:MAG: four helix bundle protein [Verrucomicrobiae bacterium]|nr:four helix bundle protein [Verrucomicrobiae bacterium]